MTDLWEPVCEGYCIEHLERIHDRGCFHCEEEPLDKYLKSLASQDARRRASAPFVLLKPPSKAVVGYYTLSAGKVALDEWPPILLRKLPRYDSIPVTLLGRLAVDRNYKGQRLGEFLLFHSLYKSLRAAEDVGSMAVIVDALHDRARDFYLHYGFILFPNKENRLFIMMDTIAQLFNKIKED